MYPRSIARGHHSMVSPSLCGSALFGALEPRGLALELAQVEQARTLSPTRNSGTCPLTSGLTFRCSTSSIAFARFFVSSSDYRSPKINIPSSLLLCEQIGAPLACARHRLLLPPPRDLLVVPGEEDLRHPQSAELGRARVLRSFQQALAGE